jgi:lysophospholipase
LARHEEGFFKARDNLRLFWESDCPDAPRAHVGVVHGYADHCGRYHTVKDALVARDFAVHAFDYRGHGQSGGRRGHVDRFSDYLHDLEDFWARVREQAGGKKTFLLAHSHGALMALEWAQKNPEGLAGLVLSAPYLELAIVPPRIKVLAAKLVGRIVPWLPVASEVKPEQLTRDPEQLRLLARDPLYNRTVTPRWFEESNRAQAEAMAGAPSLHTPFFLFCGSGDTVAAPAAAHRLFERAGAADKTFKEYPGALHEPMNDLGRDEVFEDISGWISKHL